MKITISREDGTNIILEDEAKDKKSVDPEKSTETTETKKVEEKKKVSSENLGLIDSIFANNLK